MNPSATPTYYLPNNSLEVRFAHSTVLQQFTVIRPITPFTMAQVLVVRGSNDPGGEQIVLKVYDPRFMFNVRKAIKQIRNLEFEARAAEFRQTNPIPGDSDDLPYVCWLEKPEGLGNDAFL
ncbi:hypothetical protein QCA50_016690 [Cerrena zonata]|uniref:Uncharacterized protein n=1 Tax=Cerrena zonata TaxID=2478898 RepID=A0AAW0FHW5_9APHY